MPLPPPPAGPGAGATGAGTESGKEKVYNILYVCLQEEVAKSVLSSVCQVSAILEKEEVEEYSSVVGQEEGVEDLIYNRARLVGP